MSSILNILTMHRTQELNEILRAEQELKAEARAAARIAQVMDVCHEIRDLCATQEEYNQWWESAPEIGFFDSACDKLLEMRLTTCQKADHLARFFDMKQIKEIPYE